MLVLILFAVVVGAGTAISPCVLPVLPAMLSASGAGGARRPLGIVLGLTVTFAITIIGIAKVVDECVGLGADPLRDALAVVVLALGGAALLVPRFGQLLERPLAGLSRLGPRSRGDGFRSGLLVGGALGFVYTPCAGPILAAVITTSAHSGRAVPVGIAYALGTGLMLFALALGGRRVLDHLRGAGRALLIQRVLGTILVLTAVAIGTMLDVKLDQLIAKDIPNYTLTAGLDKSSTVASRLETLRKVRYQPKATHGTVTAANLHDYGLRAQFRRHRGLVQQPHQATARLSLATLRGHVVLIDFWTYTCINCIRTLPYLEAWESRYRKDGLVIVGIEAPEFAFERSASNVRSAISQFGINYPVVQDNNLDTWQDLGETSTGRPTT